MLPSQYLAQINPTPITPADKNTLAKEITISFKFKLTFLDIALNNNEKLKQAAKEVARHIPASFKGNIKIILKLAFKNREIKEIFTGIIGLCRE